MTIFFYKYKNYIPPRYICQEQKSYKWRAASIDRGLVAQEVDNLREILLLSEIKRGRLVSLFTVKCVERGVIVIGIWFLVETWYFFFTKSAQDYFEKSGTWD